MLADNRNFKPVHAKVLVLALGLLVFAVDMVVPADLNIAIFYCFVIVLCAWTLSLAFLWTAAAVFAVATFPGLLLSPPPVTGPISWVNLTNRAFAIGALFLVAAFVHLRMRGFQLLEATISARKKAERELRDNETRLRLAQRAGRIGSWEWDPVQDTYTWSEECYELFGMDDDKERSFTAKWMNAISAADLTRLKAVMTCCIERGEVEFEYQYEHPLRGTRWIHTRAKMLGNDAGLRRMFGTCHDITERKQMELFLQQSKSLLESAVEQRTMELRKLSANLRQSQDDERRRIARELHDSFGQNLAGLKINLDQLAAIPSSLDLRSEEITDLLSDCLKSCNAVLSRLAHFRTCFIPRCWMRQALLPRRAGTLKNLLDAATSI